MATYRMKIDGLDELMKKLKELEEEGEHIAARALYEGAGIVADAVSKAVQGIATEPFKYAKGGHKRKPSPEEKAALMRAPHGVSKFRKRLKVVDTTVGFNQSGYVDVNFNHMNSGARTNYKAFEFKGKESTASSTLRWIRYAGGSEKFGLSKDIGRHAQNQKPVGAIANAINSGTSFMTKQPFYRQAVSTSRSHALTEMEKKLREEVGKLSGN